MDRINFVYESQERGKDFFIQALYRHAHFRRSGLFYLHVLVHLFLLNEHMSF